MIKTCRQCDNQFEITDDDLKFYDKVSPVFSEKKYQIPPPTLCPDCRQQRRLTWRNERNIYNRICDGTKKEIVTVFSEDKKFIIYDPAYWYSDQWDAMDFGRDFDFSRSFFSQFGDLLQVVPHMSRSVLNNTNSEFSNQCGFCKNCYLIFEGDHNEKCIYSGYITDSLDCFDTLHVNTCELCYECVDCRSCYALQFAQDCINCRDSFFLKNCIACEYCFGCVNVQHKKYCFFNEQLSETSYNEKIRAIHLESIQEVVQLQKIFHDFSLQFPHKFLHGSHNENSLGDYLSNTKHCQFCFDLHNAQDSKYIYYARNVEDTYDVTVWGGLEGIRWSYENHEIGDGVERIFFSDEIFGGGHYNLWYSKGCGPSCHDLFGCVSLKHKQYCILNKQYTKEEYESLVPRIIEKMRKDGEWGEFFPPSLSPFGYNETVAQEYYPLTKEEAKSKGFNWSDYESPPPQLEKILSTEQMKKLPDNIKDIPDDILNWALTCEVTGKPYRIIKQELQFYREHNLPIPRRHPDQRHKDRMALRNPRKLWSRTCNKCNKPIQTTYSPDRPEIVYCEECYLKEVY